MQEVRLWEIICGKSLRKIEESKIPLEEQLEDWLANDISLLDPNLLVIGRQVRTDFGQAIDLLCLDNIGDTVVVELKRGQTPRDTAAQALEYASWVRGLSHDDILEIADNHFQNADSLKMAFEERFETKLPDELNLGHRMLVVAGSIDARTERIVRYLSDMNVPINLATVQHFRDGEGRSFLAQVYLVEPEVAEAKSRTSSRGGPRRTINGLQELAEKNGIGKLYSRVREGIRGVLSATAYEESVIYQMKRDDGSRRAVLIIGAFPNGRHGGLGFTVHATRLEKQFGIRLDELRTWLPSNLREVDVSGWAGSSEEERRGSVGFDGSFQDVAEVDNFLQGLKSAFEASTRT